MQEQFSGKVVVVTGASAGIGRAIASAFGAQGAHVAVLARGEKRLQTLSEEIRATGRTAHPIVVDVADAAAVERAADEVERVLGPIDVWVNNAMVTVFGRVDETTPEEYQRVTEVTYLGTVHGTRAALKRMQQRGRGTIVQIGSALAYRSIPIQSAYCAAKAAIRGFTDSLRAELIHDQSDIRLTMVQLAGFNTPQFNWARSHMDKRPKPVGKMFQPEIAAQAVLRAAAEAPRELWVGGPAVQTILAQRFAPGLADRMVARKAYHQHTEEPDADDRPDNLFTTVDWDEGAHGRFDDQALTHSLQQQISRHPGLLAAGLLAVGAAAGIAWARSNRRHASSEPRRQEALAQYGGQDASGVEVEPMLAPLPAVSAGASVGASSTRT
ncbi:SDR family oxidoreductase [Lysobacter korlensis]|uniref:SDR family oxidoreductase n=1 Tax=Lysobacter korlensis TaxID=553636 RepID=A0ABV6RLU9_9GAMM